MFIDNKIPYPGRTWKNLEEPGTHKAVHISLLAVSTTYDKRKRDGEEKEEEEDIRQ